MNVQQRLDALRDELAYLDPAVPGLRRRVERIQRQIAMLTEDQREPQPIPEPVRRPYR
ncbi:hypothetical protein O9Z70_06330 [Devosia sp. YIM 151766]|uniref:hypothetical protein n=1 Tax=Devosia sp. YIM 151766 TaxID=3017325 RepID=UPI00255C9B55|nr:hypothetical protein [Devosia sp. YIM 151766]WIY54134.1 hypothetical protein O9Z70_06330 [Devosia sp. YIM 151766]